MSIRRFRSTWLHAFVLLALPGLVAAAPANTLSVTLDLAGLPSSITLCRDPGAIQQFGLDENWQIAIDVDAKTNTGDPNGLDAILLVETNTPSYPCSPSVVATDQNLISGLLVWDGTQQQFVDSGVTTNLVVDTTAHTLTISAPISGPLKSLSGQAPIYAVAAGAYTATAGGLPTSAYDTASPVTPSASTSDPSNDVQSCSSPCSTGASWYPLIDLVGVSASTTQPLPAFGANTVYVEFDLASLPASMALCRFPESSTFADSGWQAFIDVDGNPNTGLSGFDALVEAYTVPQEPNCSPNSATLDNAIQADVEHWDNALQNFVLDTDLTAHADATTGKIIVQADRSAAPLVGLSSASTVALQSEGLYPSTDPQYPFAYDLAGPMRFGVQVTAPAGDVQNCTSLCSLAASWYGQIDLVGGSVHLQDEVFGGDFE